MVRVLVSRVKYLRVERETAAEAGRTASLRPEMELPARPRTATGWTATSDAIAVELCVYSGRVLVLELRGTCTHLDQWMLLRI